MELEHITQKDLENCLIKNGTSPTKIKRFQLFSTKKKPKYYECHNDKVTVVFALVEDGFGLIGTAKRCTYAKQKDEPNFERGISIATFRMMNS